LHCNAALRGQRRRVLTHGLAHGEAGADDRAVGVAAVLGADRAAMRLEICLKTERDAVSRAPLVPNPCALRLLSETQASAALAAQGFRRPKPVGDRKGEAATETGPSRSPSG
jgi:hypothetical protein